jgi:hypothetical protein
VAVHINGAVQNELKALLHIAAGQLVVVVDGDGDRTAGFLTYKICKELRGGRVVCRVGAVAAEFQIDLVVVSADGSAGGGLGCGTACAAGAEREHHCQRQKQCNDFLHFLSPFA